jgi:signal transduction histidine kinase/CheY-like chemotaxis protein
MRYSCFKTFVTLVIGILLSINGFSKSSQLYQKDKVTVLQIDSVSSLKDVLDQQFVPPNQIAGLLNRNQSSAIWIKFTVKPEISDIYVFDFIRKDFVDMYVFSGDEFLGSYRTGYMLPASQKDMARWNTIDLVLEGDREYTFLVKSINTINEPDLDLNITTKLDWQEKMLWILIPNIGFLAILLIMSVYTLLFYFQSRIKAYFHFSMYLLTVFTLFVFISEVLRDYILPENPFLTLFSLSALLVTPYFYFQFMQSFLDTPKMIPRWNGKFKLLVQFDVVFVAALTLYFAITGDYYLYQDAVRIVILINVICGFIILTMVWFKRNELVVYFIVGSALMFVGGVIDIMIWRNNDQLGDVARIGFIVEILFFSLGLARKTQLIEEEKSEVQNALVDQLQINEQLINEQKTQLESQVAARTKELTVAKEEAEHNANAKVEFLSVMSHEIRTPMNAIVGLTHMLSGKNIDEEGQENLKTLKYSVDNLMLLINNILDYNKISSGNVTLEAIDFDLRKIIDSITHLFKSKADSKGLDFVLDIDELPSGVNGDPFRLSQVVNNFLSNAIKFTEKGSIRLAVKVRSETDDKIKVLFEIQDTGVGVPKDKRESIFNSFTQASSDTTRKFGGTGLGLSISKELVNMMGSEIILQSEIDQGSKFSFELEFLKIENLESKDLGTTDVQYLNTEDLHHLNVLVVDDNELNRMVLRKFLDKWNIKSVMAEGGKEALEKLRQEKFDIMLLDLQMPEMDGYEVTNIVRADSELKHLPIIAISADTISNVYDQVIEAGIDDFVTKPFNPDELKSKIYNHTSKISS